jgi:hypothetical protein
VFIVYITTSELWSSLLWNLLNIDFQNSSKVLLSLNLCLVLSIVSIYVNSSSYPILPLSLCLFYLTNSIGALALLILITLNTSSLSNLHKYMLLLLLLTFQYSLFSVVSWSNISSSHINAAATLNLPLIESELCNTNSYSSLLYNNISSSLTTNSIETKNFVLFNSNCTTSQEYSISVDDIIASSVTIDSFNIISILTLATYFILTYHFKSYLTIIKY